MGIYLNSDNTLFQQALNSRIYIDKSNLIAFTNSVLYTEEKAICVSRPRRFGKSMAANMLTAYYSRGCDSKEMFRDLKIAKSKDFEKNLNRYNVIHINMTEFLIETDSMEEMLQLLQKSILFDLLDEFPDVRYFDATKLQRSLRDVYAAKKTPFIFIIDEWDCIFREHKNDSAAQKKYLDFLRNLLKDQSYVALAYMTGILPIKKYGEHSALNMFHEYSMTNAEPIEEFTGFTEEEVQNLCKKYQMDFQKTKQWYDGYHLGKYSIYNPKSVVEAIGRKRFDNYWTQTETYEALKVYIDMNFDGMKDKVTQMIAGERVPINPGKFQNDMTTFSSADDVLTLLVHLGYLTYDYDTKTVWIPNSEVQQEFINSIEDGGWEPVMDAIRKSDELLQATLELQSDKVAEMIEQAHQENVSILKYHNENSMTCVLSLAYYSAKKNYVMYRELAGGKGFADLVFVPRKGCETPAFIAELKWDNSAKTAITQIHEKQYVNCLQDYTGEVILVGVNYDKDTKKHTCLMKKIYKD